MNLSWKIVFMDLETVPSGKPTLTRTGRAIPNAKKSNMIQISLRTYDNQSLLRNLNINPEVNWEDISGFTSYVERAWETKHVAEKANTLPNLKTAWPLIVHALTRLQSGVVLAAHNGSSWDFIILNTQMRLLGLSFPSTLQLQTWDTRALLRQWSVLPKGINDSRLGFLYRVAFEGKRIKNQHTAEADVQALRDLTVHLAQRTCGIHVSESELVSFIQGKSGVRKEQDVLFCRSPAPTTATTTTLETKMTPKVISLTTSTTSTTSTTTTPTDPSLIATTVPVAMENVNTKPNTEQKIKPTDVVDLKTVLLLSEKKLSHGSVKGLGKTTIQRLEKYYKMIYFRDLFSWYTNDAEFKRIIQIDCKKSPPLKMISNLCTYAKLFQQHKGVL